MVLWCHSALALGLQICCLSIADSQPRPGRTGVGAATRPHGVEAAIPPALLTSLCLWDTEVKPRMHPQHRHLRVEFNFIVEHL